MAGGNMTEVGRATVTIIPTMSGARQAITSGITGVDTGGIGKTLGGNLSSGFSSGTAALAGVMGGVFSQITSSAMTALGSLKSQVVEASDSTTKFAQTLQFAGVDTATIDALTKSTQEYADKTIYGISDIRNITSQLAANSIPNAEGLAEALGNVNAAAGGTKDTYSLLGLVLTQTNSAGKLTGDNWRQFSQDVPGAAGKVKDALANMGAYTGDFATAMSNGEISADEFNQAILDLGMTDAAKEAATSTQTFEGAFGQLEAGFVSIGTAVLDKFKAPMLEVINFISDTILPGIQGFIDKVSGSGIAGLFVSVAGGIGLLASRIPGLAGALGPLGGVLNIFKGPLGIIMTLVGALIAASPSLQSALGALGSVVMTSLGSVLQTLQPLFEQLRAMATGLLTVVGMALGQIITMAAPIVSQVIGLVGSIIAALLPVVTTVINMLVPVIQQLISSLLPVVAQVLGLITPIIATMSALVAQLAPVLQQLAVAAVQIIAAVLPVAVAIIQALMPLVSAIMDVLVQIAPVLVQLLSAGAQLISAILPVIVSLIQVLMPILVDMLIPAIEYWVGVMTNIIQAILPVVIALVNGFSAVIMSVANVFTGAGGTIMTIGTAVREFFEAIPPAIEMAFSIIATVLLTPFVIAGNAIQTVFQGVVDWFAGIPDKIVGFFSGIGDAISGFFSGIKLPHISIDNFSLNPADWVANGVPTLSIDWYAEGGLVGLHGPEIIGVGERGPERIIPNDQLDDYGQRDDRDFQSAVITALQSLLAKDNNTYIDGKQVSRRIAPYIDTELGQMQLAYARGL